MHPALLLLTDSRLPAGSHAHSGTAEQAIRSGACHDLPSLRSFLVGRLHTAGLVSATFTAAAHTLAAGTAEWVVLDAEVDARTAAPAQRAASRLQGRLLLRVARRLWTGRALDELAQAVPSPHHPLALGAAAHAAEATRGEAALAAAYHSITGAATAAVRLLGLDPVEVHALLAALAPDLTAVSAQADAGSAQVEWAELVAVSAPGLDLLAEGHAAAEDTLFVS